MQSAKKVLMFMGFTMFGCVLGILILDKFPTKHLDWTDYWCWAVCSVLIYMSLSFRAYLAARNARSRLAKKRNK